MRCERVRRRSSGRASCCSSRSCSALLWPSCRPFDGRSLGGALAHSIVCAAAATATTGTAPSQAAYGASDAAAGPPFRAEHRLRAGNPHAAGRLPPLPVAPLLRRAGRPVARGRPLEPRRSGGRVHARGAQRRRDVPPVLVLLPRLEHGARSVERGLEQLAAGACRALSRLSPRTTGRATRCAWGRTAGRWCARRRTTATRAASCSACENQWAQWTGWTRVSKGSHAGHIPLEPEYVRDGRIQLALDPSLMQAVRLPAALPGRRPARAHDGRRRPRPDPDRDAAAATCSSGTRWDGITPPWLKEVYREPLSNSTS